MKLYLAIFQVSGSSAVLCRICQVKGNLVRAGRSLNRRGDNSCLSLSWIVKHRADVHNTAVKQHNFVSASWLHLWVALSKGIAQWALPRGTAPQKRLRAPGDLHWAARAVFRVSSAQLWLWKGRLRWCRCGCKCSLGQTDLSILLPPHFHPTPIWSRSIVAHCPASAVCWYILCFGLHSQGNGPDARESVFSSSFLNPFKTVASGLLLGDSRDRVITCPSKCWGRLPEQGLLRRAILPAVWTCLEATKCSYFGI